VLPKLEPWIRNYGTIDCGYETMRGAWVALNQEFAIRRPDDEVDGVKGHGAKTVVYGHHRFPKDLLCEHPVDLLVVEQGFKTKAPTTLAPYAWEIITEAATRKPRLIVETWAGNAQIWTKGPASKYQETRWKNQGYVTRYRRVSATQVGGAISQYRLMVVRVNTNWSHLFQWSAFETDSHMVRPMSNLLRPAGLVRS
jgi:hypothetical protein